MQNQIFEQHFEDLLKLSATVLSDAYFIVKNSTSPSRTYKQKKTEWKKGKTKSKEAPALLFQLNLVKSKLLHF